ncbi:Glycosyltransferase involved in cell wall bisynthesis [Devosia crocina]|uniref:Glycosyltransferase involved in cell wall bisynthesis n=1 Tax=Devosia crocina TaxID=429728 RepID=A0A1I7NRJ2_9HYPH|nr:glycosyltransferase family 4 protein [Devosia crocina]SFV37220.1 Glycosyltransferase involved in cell wall bisynthesis [Devosia crocina]
MIVLVYPQLAGVGGIARYIESFLANLPHDPGRDVLVLHGGGDVRIASGAGFRLQHVPMPKGRLGLLSWSLRVRRLLSEMARDEQVELVNLHVPPLIPLLAIPRGVKLAVTAHTTYLGMSGQFYPKTLFPSSYGRASLGIKMMMERALFRRADHIITLTEQGRSELEHYRAGGRISIIPNGVDLSAFSSEAGAADKDIDVIFPGRIEPRKGGRSLPLIIERLVERDPAIRIAVVGYGPDEEGVAALAKRLPDNLIFTGAVPFSDMVSWLARSRLYASASFYEGLPGTCVEAMAMALPPVVWDMQFYEGLVEDGVNGFQVEPGAVDAFAEAVVAALGSGKLGQLGEAAKARVALRYDWTRIAPEIVTALRG